MRRSLWLLRVDERKPADGDTKKPRIRCPKCQWQPKASSRWWCKAPCYFSWNTFETRGKCPGCGFQWHDTACLQCGQWSKHDDWYSDD